MKISAEQDGRLFEMINLSKAPAFTYADFVVNFSIEIYVRSVFKTTHTDTNTDTNTNNYTHTISVFS